MDPSPPDWPVLRTEAAALVAAADAQDLRLRLIGSVGIRLFDERTEELMDALRPPPKDLDFVCRKRDRYGVRQRLETRGYENDRNMMVAMEGQRYLFVAPETGLKLDIFVDRLDFCHRIDIGRRLDVHPMTIPIEELFLHKLQIVHLTDGDRIDIGVLFAAVSPLDDDDPARFSTEIFLAPLTRDWGFWRTVTGNLDGIAEFARQGGYADFGDDVPETIAERAQTLRDAADAAPKSARWKLRAKVGERMRWWQDVDDREGTY